MTRRDDTFARVLALHPSPSDDATRARSSMVDACYEALKRKIINNEFPPGFQALEQELADLLGVSRTPVREALPRLQEDGLIERLPRRGIRVLAISPEDFREIFDLLTCLEAKAVELLIARGFPDGSAPFAEMAEAIAEGERALDADDLDAWADADRKFHRAILLHCGNRRLARTAFGVWDQFRRAEMTTLRLRPKPTTSPVEHRQILAEIQRGDVAAAQAHMRDHGLASMRVLIGVLGDYRIRHL